MRESARKGITHPTTEPNFITQYNDRFNTFLESRGFKNDGSTYFLHKSDLKETSCDKCKSLSFKIFKADELAKLKEYPPYHKNCRCSFVIVSDPLMYQSAAMKRSPLIGYESNYNQIQDYLYRSINQVLLGDFADDKTALGTAGEITVDFSPLGPMADIRNIVHSFINWGWSPEHIAQFALNAIAFVPFVGSLKYTDEAADIIKGGKKLAGSVDDVGDVGKGIGKAADAADDVGDVAKSAGKVADDIGDIVKRLPNFENAQIDMNLTFPIL